MSMGASPTGNATGSPSRRSDARATRAASALASPCGPAGAGEELVDTGIPAVDLADQGKRLRGKFQLLTSARLGSERSEALADAVGCIDRDASLADVLRLSCGSGKT